LTEGAERSSRLRHETDVEGKEISRKAVPRIGFKVLSEPDFLLAGSRVLPSRKVRVGKAPGDTLKVFCATKPLNDRCKIRTLKMPEC
jgi:hypothetical protein